ncbi:HmuY family protein [Myroides sp. 1354]|uniref:HmuY family protein n=1 Tax=unclassified Myroides TaxID=2642485 RepID=UPI0025785AFC|nr:MULTISPECIES: HmuY family protein [unclassified Myroides]MDM1043787.1 HmuY family protein [Myroides sp. R163-1]MDM1054722.1 HmuY family protein [Myroides sp. 1354]MDM1068019.1 HmuY family protein [Myroides sp. 1372]
MKNYKLGKLVIALVALVFFSSCEKDSNNGNSDVRDFIVAFDDPSIPYREIETTRKVDLVFSEMAQGEGSVEIQIIPSKAIYGVDFATIPAANNLKLIVPFSKGMKSTSFTFENLIFPYDRMDKTIQFNIVKVNYNEKTPKIQGYNVMMISFDTSLGGIMTPNVGGPTQPNQVYVDLGGKAMYEVKRNTWDLAFDSGSEFRVRLNGSVYMAAGIIQGAGSIDDVREDNTIRDMKNVVKIGTFDPANLAYIDDPSGDPNKTAIQAISDNDANNKVYLINMGFDPGEDAVEPGSVLVTGKERGWKKVRILKREGGYLLQYADINDSTHKEVMIPKSAGFNFTFYSFNTNRIVQVEPSKTKWDLNFTVFTNKVDQGGDPKGSYGYSDFIVQNSYGGVKAYKVIIPAGDKNFYKAYNLQSVEENLLSSDFTTIGGTWREVANAKVLYKNVFYVIKDAKGHYYKMRMLDFFNEKGDRGYPKFEYSLLR